MANYLGTTPQEQKEMLHQMNLQTVDELFQEIPTSVKIDKLALPSGESELKVKKKMLELANKNKVYSTISRCRSV
ncbi:hypothetical protein [Enterococcus rivorum]|uniref:hypothetical protein n=1 Tax=Enterococcus rivorum TaxID=762845 RepID=UPI00364094A1